MVSRNEISAAVSRNEIGGDQAAGVEADSSAIRSSGPNRKGVSKGNYVSTDPANCRGFFLPAFASSAPPPSWPPTRGRPRPRGASETFVTGSTFVTGLAFVTGSVAGMPCGHALAGDCPGRGQSDTGRRPQCRGRAQRSSVLGAPIIQSDNSASSILPASCVQYAGEYCARADARYCSKACKKAALRARKGDKNDDALSDTWQADLSPFSVQETQQNQGSKSAPQESGFSGRRCRVAVLALGVFWHVPLFKGRQRGVVQSRFSNTVDGDASARALRA